MLFLIMYLSQFLMILVSNVLFCCSGCSDSCDLITLGTYRNVDNYAVNGAENVVSGFFFTVCIFFCKRLVSLT